jgi:hypothetical protein
MATPKRFQVVLKRPTQAAAIVTWAKAIVQALEGDPTTYPTPTPPLSQVKADIDAFNEAHIATLTRTQGTVAARRVTLDALLIDFDGLRQYVQSLASTDPDNAGTIITSALMYPRQSRAKGKAPLAVRPAPSSGYAVVIAKAVKNAAHEWAYSLDGGETWIVVPSSLQAKVTVGPLKLGVLAKFRHRVVTKTGPGEWDDPVSLIVV